MFHGEVIAILHPYQFAMDEQAAREIMEAYDYEWTDEEYNKISLAVRYENMPVGKRHRKQQEE